MLTLVQRDRERVGELTARILDDVRDVLEGGLNAGETLQDMATRIRAAVGPVRAERIARTEAIAAANSGTVEGYQQSGVQEHEWLATRDQFTREAHADADGQRVALGQLFDVGGESLEFPGDPSGSAENIINCRCTVTPVVGG
jgi:SPP1 gp7 family putative phage head morphogenesis protein